MQFVVLVVCVLLFLWTSESGFGGVGADASRSSLELILV